MPAYTDKLEGELTRFSFRSDDGAFGVARIRGSDGKEHIAVGPVGHVTEGQYVHLEGRWQVHAQFGRQLRIESVLIEDPRTIRGLERYLASGAVHGLGKEFARRVVDHFGLDTLRVIEEEPERLIEVSGIGKKRMAEIVSHWERDQAHREVHATLRGFGIGQALSNRIVEQYGGEALAVVTHTPYRLAAEVAGVGFRTADTIARTNGIALDDPSRAEAALIHVLREAEGQGHCFVPRGELVARAVALEVPPEAANEAVARMCGGVAATGVSLVSRPAADPATAPIYRPAMDAAEHWVATDLRRLGQASDNLPVGGLLAIQERLGLRLNGDQERAVRTALEHGVAVITGGPGTGKTTIVRVLVEAARRRSEKWLLAAPTGRAAKRLCEATGMEAKTIHRLLEYNGRTRRFTRDPTNPLEADGVLVDEASMVDVVLARSLFGAIPDGCRLVLVGDADQLPSVGPGRVLGDVIDSGAVPVATLTEVYRQAADSGIITNAHRVNQGLPPISARRGEADADFFIVPRDEAIEAQATLLQVVSERLPSLGFDPLRDVQVLTPMHNGVLGTTALNEALQRLLNPDGRPFKRGNRELRVGDRVVQVRNDYDHDVFNGDLGVVSALGDGGVVVDFAEAGDPPREVALKGEALDDIELAYALSIHKSQGSEYPAVVIALHRSHRIMLRRNLLYTAMTRAKRFCCIVGSPWAVRTAVAERGGSDRWTRLAERLTE